MFKTTVPEDILLEKALEGIRVLVAHMFTPDLHVEIFMDLVKILNAFLKSYTPDS